jgi:hypothetical protein
MNMTALVEKTKSKFVCEFCEKSFAREESIAVHMCEQKRRYHERNEPGVRIGLQAYLKFYEHSGSRNRSFDDFAKSSYYRAFVKFGRYCVDVNVINPTQFMTWLLKNNKKIDRWCSDQLYTEYLIEYLKFESVEDALTRALLESIAWGDETGCPDRDFLRYGNINRICHHITTGKISAWVLYNCSAGEEFLNRLPAEQLPMIWSYIDTDQWHSVIRGRPADQQYVREILSKAGW